MIRLDDPIIKKILGVVEGAIAHKLSLSLLSFVTLGEGFKIILSIN